MSTALKVTLAEPFLLQVLYDDGASGRSRAFITVCFVPFCACRCPDIGSQGTTSCRLAALSWQSLDVPDHVTGHMTAVCGDSYDAIRFLEAVAPPHVNQRVNF
jgi:hypothetical protein